MSNKYSIFILLDVFVVLTIFFVFLIVTWGRWAHPIVDFGREVYIPWRINGGDVLYKDMAYLFGAFPPYWNALLFKIFTPTIDTLLKWNVLITTLSIIFIHRFFYRNMDRLSAFIVTLGYVMIFVCTFYKTWNMYYLAPYTHSNFYAIFFTICTINVFDIYVRRMRILLAFLLGFLIGLILLSRLEIFLAVIIGLVVGLFWCIRLKTMDLMNVIHHVGALIAGLVCPLLAFYIYFIPYLPSAQIVQSIIGYQPNWMNLSVLGFYTMQYVIWAENLKWIIIIMLWYVVLYGCLHVLCRIIIDWRQKIYSVRNWLFIFVVMMIFFNLTYRMNEEYLFKIFRPQVFLIVLLGIAMFQHIRIKSNQRNFAPQLCLLMLCVIAFVMLGKKPLQADVRGYGLIYNMFATLLSIAFCVYLLPKYFDQRYGLGWFVRALICMVFGCFFIVFFVGSIQRLLSRDHQIIWGKNVLWSTGDSMRWSSARAVESFLLWSKENLKSEDRFLVLPEGSMLNFLTQHKIGGMHVTFMPAELAIYSERLMLNSLRADPPEYIVLIHKDWSAYGGYILGKNYAITTIDWVRKDYRYVWHQGDAGGKEFGMIVYKRK